MALFTVRLSKNCFHALKAVIFVKLKNVKEKNIAHFAKQDDFVLDFVGYIQR